MRPCWVRVGRKADDKCPHWREDKKMREDAQGGGRVKTKTEPGLVRLQAEEGPEFRATTKNQQREAYNGSSPGASRRNQPCQHLDQFVTAVLSRLIHMIFWVSKLEDAEESLP